MIQENLKKARLNKGLLQKDLAIKINVTSQTIGNWENSEKNIFPPIDKLLMICDILEVSLDEIVENNPIEKKSEQTEEEKTETLLETLENLPDNQKDVVLQLALQNNTLLADFSEKDKKIITQTAQGLSELLLNARSGVRTLDTLIKSQVLCQLS